MRCQPPLTTLLTVTTCVLVTACQGPIEVSAEGPDAAVQAANLGEAQLALAAPYVAGVDHIDYTLTFTFMDSEPPLVYNTEHATSVKQNGELISILPCRTRDDGEGLNQVDVHAEIYFVGETEPLISDASTLFICVRNADTAVNILMNVVTGLDAGFVDVDVAPTGTLCASKIDFKDDGFLGVCPESSCGDNESVFVFANTCATARGREPTFWVCGDPSDWVLHSTLAESLFPVPHADGNWTFGVIALDAMQMTQLDLSLTDADKFLKVWAGVSASFATLTQLDGAITEAEIDRRQFAFATELRAAPLNAGEPSPTLMLMVDNTDLGAEISQLERFGLCDQQVQGRRLYLNHDVVDVRLDTETRVRLLLRQKGATLIGAEAFCEAGWSPEQQPIITCHPHTPLTEL